MKRLWKQSIPIVALTFLAACGGQDLQEDMEFQEQPVNSEMNMEEPAGEELQQDEPVDGIDPSDEDVETQTPDNSE